MRTEAALPCCRRSRQSIAFGATIEDNLVSAIVENSSRCPFNKGFISCVSKMLCIRIIGEETGMNCGFSRLSLRLHIASPSCGLHCYEQVPLCSLLNRSHEAGVPSDNVLGNIAFVFHRMKEITTWLAKASQLS
jgi:hypothetical protein